MASVYSLSDSDVVSERNVNSLVPCPSVYSGTSAGDDKRRRTRQDEVFAKKRPFHFLNADFRISDDCVWDESECGN